MYLFPPSLSDDIKRMMNSFWCVSNRGGKKGINCLRWEKMVVRKKHGSLVFRDLHRINLAMLGKLGWKFISSPEAMVSKVFKAKYFPRVEFLTDWT